VSKTSIYAIILAGGNGERFWPFSTKERPKQFLDIFGGVSLIRRAVERLKGIVPPENVFVVTAAKFVPATRRELPAVPAGNIVGEPCRRDTAAAMAAACGLVKRAGGPDAVGIALPADSVVRDEPAFRRALRACVASARRGALALVGVRPDRPACEFGYIELAGEPRENKACRVSRFVEKPDARTAAEYVASGRFVWNAGIFTWTERVLENAFAKHAPELLPAVEAGAKSPAARKRAMDAVYPSLPKISFDYAVLEKLDGIEAVAADAGWDDVGSWAAMEREFGRDALGNTVFGRPVAAVDSEGCILVSSGVPLGVIGMKDVVAVATPRGVLVAPRGRLDCMKRLAAALEAAEGSR